MAVAEAARPWRLQPRSPRSPRRRRSRRATSAGSCGWRCWHRIIVEAILGGWADQRVMLERLERPLPLGGRSSGASWRAGNSDPGTFHSSGPRAPCSRRVEDASPTTASATTQAVGLMAASPKRRGRGRPRPLVATSVVGSDQKSMSPMPPMPPRRHRRHRASPSSASRPPSPRW